MRETGSKSKKWEYVIQNKISPNFRFAEVGISEHNISPKGCAHVKNISSYKQTPMYVVLI